LQYLPNVLTLTKTIQNLNHPNILEKISKEHKLLLKIGYFETLTNLKVLELNENELNISNSQNKLKNTLKFCYQIIGIKFLIFVGFSCKYGGKKFWENKNLYELFSNYVFSNINLLNNYQMSNLFSLFIEKFIENCPENLYDSLLTDILTPLFKLTKNKLDLGWENIILTNNGFILNLIIIFRSNNSTIDMEVIEERWMRNFTKELIEIFHNLIKNLSITKQNPNPKPSKLLVSVLSGSVGEIMMMIIASILNYPDTFTCNKSINIIKIILPHLPEKYNEIIFGEVFQKLIRALMSFPSSEVTFQNDLLRFNY
jgi:hypothetical protein